MTGFWHSHRNGVRLFALVFMTLVMELSLIRFASAEIFYLGYFANYILMSAFLGIGLGFLSAKREVSLFGFLPQMLLFFLCFMLLTHIDLSPVRASIGQVYFGSNTATPGTFPLPVALPLIFLTTVFLFAAAAQETARAFSAYRPIVAYTIDIAGSLAGIVTFTLMSYAGAPPTVWFGLVYALVLLLSHGTGRFNAITMTVGAIIVLLAAVPSHYVKWTPYQKIEVTQEGDMFLLRANGIWHQAMGGTPAQEPFYDVPYRIASDMHRAGPYHRALIIGAGSGTDVAHALAHGVEHIDAVEIDPEIQRAGMLFHPEHPYDSPRVSRFINDGRAFMQEPHEPYDLILFALPDSLALASSLSSIRLESYLFTVESFAQARTLLSPDGVLVLYNYYRRPWLLTKMASMLDVAFTHPPLIILFSPPEAGLSAALAIGRSVGGPPLTFEAARPTPATDDWPFLYLEEPGIPPIYLGVMGMFVVGGLAGLFVVGRASGFTARTHLPLFFMGAAFLLLETKSVIQFSLLFGATWLVNALVFAAVLTSVLIANLIVMRFRLTRSAPYFAALLVAIAVGYFFPVARLLVIASHPVRYLVASGIIFSPVFFANLAFGILFKDREDGTSALAWNLMGTMLGGTCEYMSLWTGYRNLALIVALFYVVAAALALSRPRAVAANAAA